MILFIFEGKKPEENIYSTIKEIFELKDEIIHHYGTTIYGLYKELSVDGDFDLIRLISEKNSNIKENIKKISQVFLFFDYDKHATNSDDEKISEMLGYFDNETENGKLFISYPMIESIRYCKKLPDNQFYSYFVKPISNCKEFKKMSHDFSHYRDLNFITLQQSFDNRDDVKVNWHHLIKMNVCKANYICSGKNEFPLKKNEISQRNIFESHKTKYSKENKISILNAFPLFVYEYFDRNFEDGN